MEITNEVEIIIIKKQQDKLNDDSSSYQEYYRDTRAKWNVYYFRAVCSIYHR